MERTLPRLPALIALGCLTLSQCLAAQITPAGPEVRADSGFFSGPSCPYLAVAPDRSFEIAWRWRCRALRSS